MLSDYNYKDYSDTDQQLAARIINKLRESEELAFPIDPFKLLSMNGVIYQFKDFKELEGIYIVPDDSEDIPIVGINFNRPITRQRFTAAHELCHHIKDQSTSTCPINGSKKDHIEKFADQFASELLMPRGYFEVEARKYTKEGFVNFDDALKLSGQFGVSLESCVFTLAYRCNMIEGDTSAKEIKKKIRKYQPEKKRMELGLESYEPFMRDQIINSYKYFFKHDMNFIWHKFKNDYIYNESKIEGSKLERDLVSEIVTDLRLHKMLYQYAPFPEAAGAFRETNNLVTDSKFETTDYKEILNEILKVDTSVKELIATKDGITVADFIEKAIIIHHRLTAIHPFHDGNGRVSRIFLNWLFRYKGLPPVYLKYHSKEKYYAALQHADLNHDFAPLKEVFYTEIIGTMIQLYDGRRITDEVKDDINY